MKPAILAIHASERADGNTAALLEQAISGAEGAGAVIERLIVREKNFSPCVACGGCADSGACVLDDDMTDIYRLFDGADHIIVASPIYFCSIPGRFKCMVDRCQALWEKKYVLKQTPAPGGIRRRGAFLSCCGHSDGDKMFPVAEKTIRMFFNCLNVKLKYRLYSPGTDAAGAIFERKELLDRAREIGAALAAGAPATPGGGGPATK